MKKKNIRVIWGVIGASLLLILLCVFINKEVLKQENTVVIDVKEETEQEKEEYSEEDTFSEEQKNQATQEQSITEEETTEQEDKDETVGEEVPGYIIIGESHIVVTDGQGYALLGSTVDGVVYKENLFFVHTGLDPVMGTFAWFSGEGTEQIQEIQNQHTEITKWTIISIHGTSMCTAPDIADQYIDTYTKWINELFADDSVYIVSVPPLDEQQWVVNHPDRPPRYNADIISFNEELKTAFPEQYVDCYDWFLENGVFQDEIHYTGETYRDLFDMVIEQTREK